MENISLWFVVGGLVFIAFYIGIRYLIKYFTKPEKLEKATSFLCIDGHKVRSKGELVIDNYLHKLGLNHEYEKTIKVRGENIKYDWFLIDYGIYIEYWGYFGKVYLKRKEEKLNLYRKGKLKLISVEDIMLMDIYLNLKKELERFINLDSIKKHCPSCGNELDERV